MRFSFTIAPAIILSMLILGCASAPALAKHSHHRASASSRPLPSLDLYSRRALRRARTILQLKLLELREEHLDRVRRVIEKRLPLSTLFSHDS